VGNISVNSQQSLKLPCNKTVDVVFPSKKYKQPEIPNASLNGVQV